jgi:hypothetical protein
MKKIKWFVPAALLLLTIPGCKRGPAPREVASKFLQAVLNSNYQEAKKYATKDSESLLTALASLTGALPAAERAKIRNSKISIRDVAINGDLATVTYINSGEDRSETLNLKKEKGQWRVAFTKDYVLPQLDTNRNDSATNSIIRDTNLKSASGEPAR